MRTILTLSLLVALFTSWPAAADDSQQLLDLEHRWLTAAMQRDLPTLRDILADDFVDVSYQGTLRSKADHLRATLAPSKSKQDLEELKVRSYGYTGIVTGLNVVVTADGSATYRIRFTDVFVKRGGRWQAVSAQETPVANP